MSRFAINEKLYDTTKMEHVGNVKKWYRNTFWSDLLGVDRGQTFVCKCYRSKKDNYLLVHEDGGNVFGDAITEREAKELLIKYDYDNYRQLFGDLEEA